MDNFYNFILSTYPFIFLFMVAISFLIRIITLPPIFMVTIRLMYSILLIIVIVSLLVTWWHVYKRT
ncbi:hypothetical protein SK37_04989 [Citrobacter sp. MGH109]|nr:hypothetical protein SK37_04989 [Citrobacter sp. MGH109]CAI9395526.1 hypothetical protein CITSP_05011 [Citrobacter sp. T1.2D-1]